MKTEERPRAEVPEHLEEPTKVENWCWRITMYFNVGHGSNLGDPQKAYRRANKA